MNFNHIATSLMIESVRHNGSQISPPFDSTGVATADEISYDVLVNDPTIQGPVRWREVVPQSARWPAPMFVRPAEPGTIWPCYLVSGTLIACIQELPGVEPCSPPGGAS